MGAIPVIRQIGAVLARLRAGRSGPGRLDTLQSSAPPTGGGTTPAPFAFFEPRPYAPWRPGELRSDQEWCDRCAEWVSDAHVCEAATVFDNPKYPLQQSGPDTNPPPAPFHPEIADPWRREVLSLLLEKDRTADAERFEACGLPMVLRCSENHHPRLAKYWCERKLCPECARRHAAATAEKWLEIAKKVPRRPGFKWVLLTLTVKVTGDLKADYQTLMRGWRKLTAWWNRRIHGHGGFRSVEVGSGKNVHMHVLAYMPWLDHDHLVNQWLNYTGGSSVLDIRAVRGRLEDAMREVAKYLCKWPDLEPRAAVDLYLAFERTQPHRSWGICYGTGIVVPVDQTPCPSCGCSKWYPDGRVETSAVPCGP